MTSKVEWSDKAFLQQAWITDILLVKVVLELKIILGVGKLLWLKTITKIWKICLDPGNGFPMAISGV